VVYAGEFFGVFGPNGAGKSTFIKLLTGQLSPSLGSATVLGTNVAQNPQKIKANVGIVPESESPPSYLTSAEYLDFVCRIRGIPDIQSQLLVGLVWH
jgi:ABC-2 type transport system ATP-binding protein